MMVRRRARLVNLLLCFVAFALLIVRTADAHVHLCFDGMEPRSSVRVFGEAFPCDIGDSTRQDRDIDALGTVLVTKGAQAETWGPLPAPEVTLFLLPPQRGSESEITARNPSPKLPDLFLPLVRGPPG